MFGKMFNSTLFMLLPAFCYNINLNLWMEPTGQGLEGCVKPKCPEGQSDWSCPS